MRSHRVGHNWSDLAAAAAAAEAKIPHATWQWLPPKIKLNGWILFCLEAHLSNQWPIIGQLLITEIMSFFYCNEVVCALELTCSSRPIWALELACALPFSQYIPGSRIPRSKSTHIFILNLLFFFWTPSHVSGSPESWPLDGQGIPHFENSRQVFAPLRVYWQYMGTAFPAPTLALALYVVCICAQSCPSFWGSKD